MSEAPININVTPEANVICQDLVASKYFSTKQDAYVYALNLALALELPLDSTLRPSENLAHTAQIFQKVNRDLFSLMKLFGYKQEEIVQKGILLAEAGLRYINSKRIQNLDILDVLINGEID